MLIEAVWFSTRRWAAANTERDVDGVTEYPCFLFLSFLFHSSLSLIIKIVISLWGTCEHEYSDLLNWISIPPDLSYFN